jgi:uncharacterized cupin superfamily protein
MERAMTEAKTSAVHSSVFLARVVAPRIGSNYPPPLRDKVSTRVKRALGDAAGLRNFGVNLVELPPGAWSALRHWHSRQDELVYILEGRVMLITEAGEQELGPGMAVGFPAGKADGHHLVNKSDSPVVYLEVGDRAAGDEVSYPDNDLVVKDADGRRAMFHKSGEPY